MWRDESRGESEKFAARKSEELGVKVPGVTWI